MTGLIGRKLGMTRVFDAEGAHVPVTVIEAGPCPVVHVAGTRIELGFGVRKPKRTAKALAGHVKKAGLETAPQVLRSFVLVTEGEGAAPKPGENVTVAIFAEGDRVKITGVTKGRGFQGVVHRHHFHGGPETHGNTGTASLGRSLREPTRRASSKESGCPGTWGPGALRSSASVW